WRSRLDLVVRCRAWHAGIGKMQETRPQGRYDLGDSTRRRALRRPQVRPLLAGGTATGNAAFLAYPDGGAPQRPHRRWAGPGAYVRAGHNPSPGSSNVLDAIHFLRRAGAFSATQAGVGRK